MSNSRQVQLDAQYAAPTCATRTRLPARPASKRGACRSISELVYNNLSRACSAGNFPVIRATLRRCGLANAGARFLLSRHHSHTPLFPELGREFLRYLEARQQQGRGDPAFLLELAHYEWVELALALDEHDPRRHRA
jgi:hypothetical protein